MTAETIVFRDGVFCPELSTLKYEPINNNYDKPVHIIYVGEIDGDNTLNISAGAKNQDIFVSANIKIKKPAVLNIFIENAGENTKISGTFLIQNNSDFVLDCNARHLFKKTAILIKNKILADKNSNSKLSGTAIIDEDCAECDSDIAFIAMKDENAKIEFMPGQKIKSIPNQADHSASVYKPNDAQLFYLRNAGLGTGEIDETLKEAFLSF